MPGKKGALLKDLLAKLGKRFVDILVADAIYLQAPFVRALESLGPEWVINLKDNQPDLAAEAARLTNRPADYRETTARPMRKRSCNSGICPKWTGP